MILLAGFALAGGLVLGFLFGVNAGSDPPVALTKQTYCQAFTDGYATATHEAGAGTEAQLLKAIPEIDAMCEERLTSRELDPKRWGHKWG